jgi:predicted  nucleic acid-binding Zn-ribbon protein
MTEHDERPTRVQEELWYLINDEDVKQVLEAMIDKMKKVEESFECIKQWRQEAQAYIPDDPKCDENYWVAAYILYTNMKNFKDLFDEFDNIRQEHSKLWDEIKELRHKEEKLKDRIEKLQDKLPSLRKNKENKVVEDLLCEIDKCEKDLEDMIEMHHKKSERYFYLNNKLYYHLLPEIIKRAEQLVSS